MIKIIGVRFRTAGKIYFFDPLNYEIKKGAHVIVETARGIEFGLVVAGVMEVADDKVVQPLKPVIRIANQRDIEQETSNREKEKEAFRICLEKIREHKLEMKLIDAEYTFDNNKVLFYFTADGRIDFRELVKDLASVFKTRIELRQIGVRDETKIMGGIGICGRALCCHSYLADFIPVSIKMAKEQNLSLNPAKISGVCGRLMCCLKNEEETYEALNKKLPGIGDTVTTQDGLKGEVHSVNVLRQTVKVVVDVGDEKDIKEYPVEKLSFRRRHGRKEKVDLSREELQELERLEVEEKPESSGQAADSAKAEGDQRQGGRNRRDGRSRQGEGSQRANSLKGNSQRGGVQRGTPPLEAQSGGQRQPVRRSNEARPQSGHRSGGGNRQPERHSDEEQKREKQPAEGKQAQPEQHPDEAQAAGQRQGGRKRQSRNRQNARHQQNSENQGGKNRHDDRNRQDTKSGQEG